MMLPEYDIDLIPRTKAAEDARGYKWAEPDMGHRFKIGGTPDGLEQEEIPACPSCQEPMSFYAQLDGIGDDYDLADCGMIYVFCCFGCFETASFLKSY